jgi:hypothetical protein
MARFKRIARVATKKPEWIIGPRIIYRSPDDPNTPSLAPQSLKFSRSNLNVAQYAAESPDFQCLVSMNRNRRAFPGAIHKMMRPRDSYQTKASPLQEPHHFLARRPGQLRHGQAPSNPNLPSEAAEIRACSSRLPSRRFRYILLRLAANLRSQVLRFPLRHRRGCPEDERYIRLPPDRRSTR